VRSPYCLCSPPIVARQRLDNVPATTNTHAKIEELLDAVRVISLICNEREAGD
jgi:hypothetical protein